MIKNLDQCQQCKAIPKDQNNLRYCIKCGESICTSCRIKYFCKECNTIEKNNDSELELTAKMKPIMVHLYKYMTKSEYNKFIQMVTYWLNRRMYLGNEIFGRLKSMYCNELCETLEAVRQLIIYEIDLPLHIKLPEQIYRPAIRK